MTKLSDAAVPSFILTETANASIGTPAAGKHRLFFDTDHSLKEKNDAGTVATIGSGGSGGGGAGEKVYMFNAFR